MAPSPVTPPAFLLDTSVVVKWFRRYEPDTETALLLLQRYLDGACDLAVPEWLFIECANVLRWKPGITEQDVTAAVEAFEDLNMRIISLTTNLLQQAVAFAFRGNVSIYDALFVACAAQEKMCLVTADADLARLSSILSVQIQSLKALSF
jgi:predicted nucleic acid-binding protein